MAGLLVVSLVTTMLGPWLHADDGHDADFSAAVVHDASQHRLTSDTNQAASPSGEQHCVACHFVRLVREHTPVLLAAQTVTLGPGIGYDRAGHLLPQIGGPPLPARAPPVSLFA